MKGRNMTKTNKTNGAKVQRYRYLALLLAVILLFTACAAPPQTQESIPDTGAQTTASKVQETQEETPAQDADQDMDQLLLDLADRMFRSSLLSSTVNLHYTLRYPENFGLEQYPITWGEPLTDSMPKAIEQLKDYEQALAQIDPELLTEENRLTYDIIDSYIQTELPGEDFIYHYQPLSSTIGLQAQLPFILAEYQFYSPKDVDEYLELLAQLDEFFSDLIQWENLRLEQGFLMSDVEIDHIIDSCEPYLDSPETGMLAETFETRLDLLTDLTKEERNQYISQNQEILKQDFTNAYQLLEDGLTALKGNQSENLGLFYLPDGQDYYWYLLNSTTYTTYESPQLLERAILNQMFRDIMAMAQLLEKNPQLEEDFMEFQFALTDPQEILEDLKVKIKEEFPEIPDVDYSISYVPESMEETMSPAFYLSPALDHYLDNIIYINNGNTSPERDLYSTLAHEGYPGHLYQSVYFYSTEPLPLRAVLNFSSYVEGWATYVEYLSYDWAEGIDPDLAAVQSYNSKAMMALYALLDYYIHYEGWNMEQVDSYLSEMMGIDDDEVTVLIYDAIVENPVNYMEYYLGYLEISSLRKTAEGQLKDQFDAKEFHKFLLDIGPAPFPVIRERLGQWMEDFPVLH